jgi:TP901 family phage tail tape measure protein
MAVDTQLLDAVVKQADRVQGSLLTLGRASRTSAKDVKETTDQLRKLQQQQAAVGEYHALTRGLSDTASRLRTAQNHMALLNAEVGDGAKPSADNLRALRQAQAEEQRLFRLRGEQRTRLKEMQQDLRGAGVDLSNLGAHERNLRNDITATTARMKSYHQALAPDAQRLERLDQQRERLGRLQAAADKTKALGTTMLAPVRSAARAYLDDDQAAAGLRTTMAGPSGTLGPEYQQALKLANQLGVELPGSTADFIGMLEQLRRQGVSAQDMLGGVGEHAAKLGAVLKMPAKEAADFGARLQQATQTSAGGMAALADSVQRTAALGLDAGDMLKSLEAVGKAVPQLGQQGPQSAQMLGPLLLMLNEAQISGKGAGDALGQMLKNVTDPGKVKALNEALRSTGVALDFNDAKGQFAGMDQMLAQLQKLDGLKDAKARASALDQLSGGDKAARQALEVLMRQGPAAYQALAGRQGQQASLGDRLAAGKDSPSAEYEAARDNFHGLLSDIGATIGPEIQSVLQLFNSITSGLRSFVQNNPGVVKAVVMVVGTLGLLIAGLGMLASTVLGIVGPILLARTLFGKLPGGMAGIAGAAGAAAKAGKLPPGTGGAAGAAGAAARSGLMGRLGTMWDGAKSRTAGVVGSAMARLGGSAGAGGAASSLVGSAVAKGGGAASTLLGSAMGAAGGVASKLLGLARMTPLGRIAGGVAGAASSLWDNRAEISSAYQAGDWKGVGGKVLEAGMAGIEGALGGVLGLVGGLASRGIGSLFSSSGTTADPTAATQAQAAQLLSALPQQALLPAVPGAGRAGLVLPGIAAAATAATLATGAMPAMAGGPGVPIDSRPPLSAPAAVAPSAAPAGPTTIHIVVNAAPGQDAQAIARAVAAELDRRDQSRRSQVLSQLTDID